MAQVSWYLAPAALRVIASLLAMPPQRVFVRDKCSRTPHDGWNVHEGAGLDDLHKLFVAEYNRLDRQNPWPRDAMTALLEASDKEVVAALFGDPNNRDFAFPERAARRSAIAAEIHAALGRRKAA